ncbi:MAG: hypothetical protein GY712_05945 [Oceanicoccus sp.]|uniref:hypothetical protein n=1 Tax=Oceanicoccus sp. TaxID=2691044 RepID=UPI002635FBB3|nr:hypothetical protein [Oceanicoccus sp.]MCP3907542.1 hypothetical protein [Oceanicoccus sp.]MDG1772234.1 hypothetical protein [Oceanicoccus sp.]
MGNLLLVLGVLFAALFIVVKLTERHAKPVDEQQQAKMSRIAMVSIMLLLVLGLIRYYTGA